MSNADTEASPKRLLIVCSQGLCRSVALTDVLKMHFQPVDVIPIGIVANSKPTFEMLYGWADHIIAMDQPVFHIIEKRIEAITDKPSQSPLLFMCDVGPDTYGFSRNPALIDQVWRWARENYAALGIAEHNRKV